MCVRICVCVCETMCVYMCVRKSVCVCVCVCQIMTWGRKGSLIAPRSPLTFHTSVLFPPSLIPLSLHLFLPLSSLPLISPSLISLSLYLFLSLSSLYLFFPLSPLPFWDFLLLSGGTDKQVLPSLWNPHPSHL